VLADADTGQTKGVILLKLSTDRKVTNSVTKSGGARIANTIGLPAGPEGACTHATEVCEVICYGKQSEKQYVNVSALLQHNFDLLRGADLPTMIGLLSDAVEQFVSQSMKWGAPLLFRVHWDGDFFSPRYTLAWIKVMERFQEVTFWVYTRVPGSAIMLHKRRLNNLSLYFSADRANIKTARFLKAQHGIRLAYLGTTFEDAAEALPGAVRCPENNGALSGTKPDPVKGSACVQCGLCIYGRRDVLFAQKKPPRSLKLAA